jgi:uncharacterized membrane protein (UPF0127 family)
MYNNPMKKAIAILCLCLLSNGCSLTSSPPYSTPLLVGQKKIFVEVVNTPEKMAQGLSGRERLTDEQGMLFDFSTPPYPPLNKEGNSGIRPAFWMKGMKFDLDLIWIKNNKIIGITPNVPAPQTSSTSPAFGTLPSQGEETLKVYSPPTEVDMVLEVNAGWCEKNEIKIGDPIKLITDN